MNMSDGEDACAMSGGSKECSAAKSSARRCLSVLPVRDGGYLQSSSSSSSTWSWSRSDPGLCSSDPSPQAPAALTAPALIPKSRIA